MRTNRIQPVLRVRLSPLPALVILGILLALGGSASAAGPLTATGTATGRLAEGQTVDIRIEVHHAEGWQQVSEIELDLALRGKPLEQLVIDPTHDSVVLKGEAGPAALGQPSQFVGPYFRLDPATIALAAKGKRLTLSFPVTIVAAPPPDAKLTLQVRGFDLSKAGPIALTAPVETESGFSWGTLALAATAALFLGGVIGGTFASRRRPPSKPSVYAAVRRRIDEERVVR
jgi:hypothetical protein